MGLEVGVPEAVGVLVEEPANVGPRVEWGRQPRTRGMLASTSQAQKEMPKGWGGKQPGCRHANEHRLTEAKYRTMR